MENKINEEKKPQNEDNNEQNNQDNIDNDINKDVEDNNIKIEIEDNKNEIKENKDDNESGNVIFMKDDISNSAYTNNNLSNSLIRMNSECDVEQIVGGKDESQNYILYKNDNLEEKNLDGDDIDADQNLNANLKLGNLLRDVVIKKKKYNNDLRMSIYKKDWDDGPQDINFGEIINARLNEIKDTTLNYFGKTIKEFEKKYTNYINKINDYIKKNELKISKVFPNNIGNNENILEFADNNIFKQFDNILEIHENIFDAIEDHIKLLSIFLQTDLTQRKNPLEYFINNNSNDILKCWFLNKINFQKLDLANVILNKDLSELCSRYLCKKKDNKFSSITLKKDNNGNLPLESEFVKENLNNLEKLKFISLKCAEINSILINNKKEPNSIFANVENYTTAKKLRSLSILQSDFSDKNLTKISTPELNKLKLKRTPLSLSIKCFFESILGDTLFLKNLYLQKCFLDDQSLKQIFLFLSEKPQILDSLQNLSFSGNEITIVNMDCFKDTKYVFKSLQYLDFSKNNIYDFIGDNFKYIPEIKVLDLTNNNFSSYILFNGILSQKKDNQKIVLLSNNTFLNNNKTNSNNYRKYIAENLNKLECKIKKLNLSFLYNKESINKLLDLRISPMIQISLIKLDLSYCGLENDNVCYFLKNNFGLLNLEIFNLSNNFLTIKIFNLILKIDTSLENLTTLDLSMNNIDSLTYEEYKDLERFIDKHSHFKKIKLQETTFSQDLLLLSTNEKEECEKINKNLINKGVIFVVEKENYLLTEPLKELFELKDKEY